MNYVGGNPIEEGDRVLIEHGQTPGRVRDIVETASQMRKSNVNDPGLMIESAPFGLVFWPARSAGDVMFVERRPSPRFIPGVTCQRPQMVDGYRHDIWLVAFLWGTLGWAAALAFFYLTGLRVPTKYACDIVGAIVAGVAAYRLARAPLRSKPRASLTIDPTASRKPLSADQLER